MLHRPLGLTAVADRLSPRLRAVADALPLRPGLRVLEIGCGPGALARELVRRVGPDGHVLAIDRSGTAIDRARSSAQREVADGLLDLRRADVETFTLEPGEPPYDLAVAIRVGVLDGRHPEGEEAARAALRDALVPSGRLYVQGGDPLRELAP